MPLIKVTSWDGKLTKLLTANDIKGLREKGILRIFYFFHLAALIVNICKMILKK